jgi:hypothetical protein
MALGDLGSSMDHKIIRAQTVAILEKLGVSLPQHLPFLEARTIRNKEEIVSRLLAMTALAAVSYGFEKSKAIKWIDNENLRSVLTKTEQNFLFDSVGDPLAFRVRIEGMWALAWALEIVPKLDFTKECAPDFVTELPNLRVDQPGERIRTRALLRSSDSILLALDLAFGLHWYLREAQVNSRLLNQNFKLHVIEERRRALEWITGRGEWDSISLDT